MIVIVVPFLRFEIDLGLIYQRNYHFFAAHNLRLKIVKIKTKFNHLLSILTIALKPEQEEFIQAQLITGQYIDAYAVITEALRLLEKRNHYDEWVEDIRAKIDTAATQLDRGECVDGETAIDQLREKLQQAREQ
jgi:antitoxin ParD1/3/4